MVFARYLAILMFVTAPLAGQAKKGAKPSNAEKATSAGIGLPAGWSTRTDEKGKEGEVKFVVMDNGFHVSPGPAAIIWRAADKVDGPFHAVALFIQTKPSEGPQGYGLFVGGQNLTGEGAKYAYFLVRPDGKFLIQRRDGTNTMNITSTWTAHPAIVRPNAVGETTNRLEVSVERNRLAFAVNGKEVYTADPRLIDTRGNVGLRVNPRVDLNIEGFAVQKK